MQGGARWSGATPMNDHCPNHSNQSAGDDRHTRLPMGAGHWPVGMRLPLDQILFHRVVKAGVLALVLRATPCVPHVTQARCSCHGVAVK